MIAEYGGQCLDCGGSIVAGETIEARFETLMGGSLPREGKPIRVGWAHVTCPPTKFDLRKTDMICPDCWLVMPCGCSE